MTRYIAAGGSRPHPYAEGESRFHPLWSATQTGSGACAFHPAKVLLLDEPATGMTSEETEEMMNFILDLRKKFNLTILLIEHHMQVVMGICEYIYVLNYGKTIATGTPTEIQNNQEVIKAYLGTGTYVASE